MENILLVLCARYKTILENKDFGEGESSSKHLLKMLTVLADNCGTWPVDKSNRWLGYIQGVMTVYKVLNVTEERNFTRPLFHKYYIDTGIYLPDTLDLY